VAPCLGLFEVKKLALTKRKRVLSGALDAVTSCALLPLALPPASLPPVIIGWG